MARCRAEPSHWHAIISVFRCASHLVSTISPASYNVDPAEVTEEDFEKDAKPSSFEDSEIDCIEGRLIGIRWNVAVVG